MTIACLRIGVVLIKYEDLHQVYVEHYKEDIWSIRIISEHGTFIAASGTREVCDEIFHEIEYVVPFSPTCKELWCGSFDEYDPYLEDDG